MPTMTDRPGLRIGELAVEFGLNPKTIRYYEEINLLPPPQRTPTGYRFYDEGDRERLRFIGKAKALGLTLEEIGEILGLREDGEAPCERVVAIVDRKLAAVDERLRVLTEFRQELLGLRDEATRAMTADAQVCRIIEGHAPGHRDYAALGVTAPVAQRSARGVGRPQ